MCRTHNKSVVIFPHLAWGNIYYMRNSVRQIGRAERESYTFHDRLEYCDNSKDIKASGIKNDSNSRI